MSSTYAATLVPEPVKVSKRAAKAGDRVRQAEEKAEVAAERKQSRMAPSSHPQAQAETKEDEKKTEDGDDREAAEALEEGHGLRELPPQEYDRSVDEKDKLAIGHFRIRLRYMYWHYLSTPCLANCPFDHAKLGQSVTKSKPPVQASSAEQSDDGGGLSRTEGETATDGESGTVEDTDDDTIGRRRGGGRRRTIQIEEDEADGEVKEHKGEATGHAKQKVGCSEDPPFSKSTSRKSWIPVDDHEAVLVWARVLRQLDRDAFMVIHPFSTTHVEGFHDLRYDLPSRSSTFVRFYTFMVPKDKVDSEAVRILGELERSLLRHGVAFAFF